MIPLLIHMIKCARERVRCKVWGLGFGDKAMVSPHVLIRFHPILGVSGNLLTN
jgi:hypothetical protein